MGRAGACEVSGRGSELGRELNQMKASEVVCGCSGVAGTHLHTSSAFGVTFWG